MLNAMTSSHLHPLHFQKNESVRRNSSPLVIPKQNSKDLPADSDLLKSVTVDDSAVPLLKKKGSPNLPRKLLGFMQHSPKPEPRSQQDKTILQLPSNEENSKSQEKISPLKTPAKREEVDTQQEKKQFIPVRKAEPKHTTGDRGLSPRLARRLLRKKRPNMQPLHENQQPSHHKNTQNSEVDP